MRLTARAVWALFSFCLAIPSVPDTLSGQEISTDCAKEGERHPNQRPTPPRRRGDPPPDRRWEGQDSATALDYGINVWEGKEGMVIGGPTCILDDSLLPSFIWEEATATHTRIYYRVSPDSIEYKEGDPEVLAMRIMHRPATPSERSNTFYVDLPVGTRIDGMDCQIHYRRRNNGTEYWDACNWGRTEILRRQHRDDQENGFWNFVGIVQKVEIGEHNKYPNIVQQAMAYRQVDTTQVYDILAFKICALVTPEGLVPLPGDENCGIRICQMTYRGPMSVVYFFVTVTELGRMGFVDRYGRARCPDDPPDEVAAVLESIPANEGGAIVVLFVPPSPAQLVSGGITIATERTAR